MTERPAPTTADAWPLPTEDPYPTLAEMRAAGPVHRLSPGGPWLVVSHALAHEVLRAEGWSSDLSRATQALVGRDLQGLGIDTTTANVLFSDGEQHHRLRRALSGRLSPRAVAEFRPRIAAVVAAAVDAHQPGEPWDVVDELAYPVPLAVICELLDAGVEVAERLRDETRTLTALVDPMAGPDEMVAGMSAATVLTFDMVALIAERRADPGDDLLSCLAGELQPEEAVVMTLLLLVAGHETTANLIANAAIALHDHPELPRALRADPGLIPRAVEELLRWEPPVQLTARSATRSQPLGPVQLSEGDQVLISLAGANRDPSAFEQPDRVVLERDSPGHLAFGHGIHFCAGASLARAEAAEVISALVALDPPVESRELSYDRGSSVTFRRVESLVLA